MEDWMLPSPSPRTLMPSFFSEEFSSTPFSNIFSDDRSSRPQDENEDGEICIGSSARETSQDTKGLPHIESNIFCANQKPTSPGGLAERIAARAGFGVLEIDISRVGSSGAAIRSPVTIPPGVSPRELLESPVFLPNAISQLSPTTGKLPFLMPSNFESTMPSGPEKSEDHLYEDSVFSFQPFVRSTPPTLWTAKKGSSVVHQTQSSAKDSQELNLHANPAATEHETEESLARSKTCDSMFDNDHPSPDDEPEQSEENQNGEDSSAPVASPAEDGYNWRKYGQKQVKNSEHPRSYYKCTHPDCPVKKKVERSVEGHVTEIVYKGSHTHPLPLPSRRSSVPFTHQLDDSQSDGLENFSSKLGPGYHSATSQGIAPDGQFQDVHRGALETKLSGSLTTTEIADTSVMESMDVSSTLSSNENAGDRATRGAAAPPTNDRDEDETGSKRWKMEASAATTNTTANTGIDMASSMASRAAREPRIVVQTTSEVDILDDGYRWRKYGQKVVKGNPNPRSYYKCTYAGCSVRKHVERASNDLKSVITTYEGKHNHEVPAARNSGSGHPSSGSGGAAAAPQGSGLGLHRRLEPPQVSSIPRLSAAAAYGSLRLSPQLGAASGGFSFGMLRPPGMAMPVPSVGGFMPGHGPPMLGCAGLVLPRGGEAKVVSPEQQSGLPVANGNGNAAATYQQQLMGRWPHGHQM